MPTVYRAAARTTIAPATFGRGACFTTSEQEAEAYTKNPGFGGCAVAAFEADSEFVLRLDGRRDPLLVLAATLWDELVEAGATRRSAYGDEAETAEDLVRWWRDRGLVEVFHVLEMARGVAEVVAEAFDWITYCEPSVADGGRSDSVTWRYYGAQPLVGRLR